MDLSALTELFGNLAGFFGGFKDVFSGLGAIFENGAALSSGQVSTSCIEPGEACRCRLETTASVAATN
jgi:hypothetical protein